jgi:molybdopterin biosynthesis enzyme MoaB
MTSQNEIRGFFAALRMTSLETGTENVILPFALLRVRMTSQNEMRGFFAALRMTSLESGTEIRGFFPLALLRVRMTIGKFGQDDESFSPRFSQRSEDY